MNDLDTQLKEHYQSRSLSETEAERMLQAVRQNTSPRAHRSWVAAAATLLLLLGGAWFSLQEWQGRSLSAAIAAEVVTSLRKATPLTLETTELAALADHLHELPFDITPAGCDILAVSTLVGGRYCKVQGHKAAQLQYRDTQGKRHTVFVAPLESNLEDFKAGAFDDSGAEVDLWENAGRLFVRVHQ